MEIKLVSGMAAEVRHLKGRELQQVADPANVRNGGAAELMLKACVLNVTNPGPYAKWLEAGMKPDWSRVLLGDRFDALLQIRRASFGEDYEFRVQCQGRGGLCKEPYEWGLSLGDLPRRELRPEIAEALLEGVTRFEMTAPDGKILGYRLSTGADEKTANKKRREQRNAWGHIDAIGMQVVDMDGKPVSPLGLKKYLEELPWQDVEDILQGLNATDCGIETKIETECPFCGWVQSVQFPFGETFFRPSRKKAASGETDEETKPGPSAATP
jgi:hypothetical protein